MRVFPKDATSVGEKAVYVIGYGIPVIIFLYLQLSAFGVFHNFYSVACKAAGWGWKIPALIFTAALIGSLVKGFKDEREAPSNFGLFVLSLIILLLYCGFAYPYIF